MPDYLIALIKQYCGAISSEQAEFYAKAVVDAWFHSLQFRDRAKLVATLPDYLQPKSRLFFNRTGVKIDAVQSDIVRTRIAAGLQKTDETEIDHILHGFFKSLKILSDPSEKFAYSKLLDKKLLALFIEA